MQAFAAASDTTLGGVVMMCGSDAANLPTLTATRGIVYENLATTVFQTARKGATVASGCGLLHGSLADGCSGGGGRGGSRADREPDPAPGARPARPMPLLDRAGRRPPPLTGRAAGHGPVQHPGPESGRRHQRGRPSQRAGGGPAIHALPPHRRPGRDRIQLLPRAVIHRLGGYVVPAAGRLCLRRRRLVLQPVCAVSGCRCRDGQ